MVTDTDLGEEGYWHLGNEKLAQIEWAGEDNTFLICVFSMSCKGDPGPEHYVYGHTTTW